MIKGALRTTAHAIIRLFQRPGIMGQEASALPQKFFFAGV
jgi:hypothetical protein